MSGDEINQDKAQRKQAKQVKNKAEKAAVDADRDEGDKQNILDTLADYPDGATKTVIRDNCEVSNRRFTAMLDVFIERARSQSDAEIHY